MLSFSGFSCIVLGHCIVASFCFSVTLLVLVDYCIWIFLYYLYGVVIVSLLLCDLVDWFCSCLFVLFKVENGLSWTETRSFFSVATCCLLYEIVDVVFMLICGQFLMSLVFDDSYVYFSLLRCLCSFVIIILYNIMKNILPVFEEISVNCC